MTESYCFDGTPMSARLIKEKLTVYLEKVDRSCDIQVEYRAHPIERSASAEGITWPFMANFAVNDVLWLIVKIGKLRHNTNGLAVIEAVDSFFRKESETPQGRYREGRGRGAGPFAGTPVGKRLEQLSA